MMNGFVDVKKEDVSLILLNYPVVGEISDASTVDKKEEFDSIVGPTFLYACIKL
jgi:hypothetical protein